MTPQGIARVLFMASLVLSAAVRADGSDVRCEDWQSFGQRVLYFLGGPHCPPPGWLLRERRVMDAVRHPDLQESVTAIEAFVADSLQGYETDSLTWRSRIDLNVDPRCVLGLYLANKYPGTKLSALGQRQFAQSVEHACLVTFDASSQWQQSLEKELGSPDRNAAGDRHSTAFCAGELPFLLIYLAENGSSEAVQYRARERLAEDLLQTNGIEPALRQYSRLVGQDPSKRGEPAALKAAQWLEKTGAVLDARQLYEECLEEPSSADAATEAAESLARMELAGSRPARAWETLDRLLKAFPASRIKDERLREFFATFQTKREQMVRQYLGESSRIQTVEKAIEQCRRFDNLWTEEEAVTRWQSIVAEAERGGVFGQAARLFLAESLVNAERVDEGKTLLGDLTNSDSPTVRARALSILADLCKNAGRDLEAVDLYQRALRIERPTVLPPWTQSLVARQFSTKELSAADLNLLTLYLRGSNRLVDGEFAIAAEDLRHAEELASRIHVKDPLASLKETMPTVLMLAYAGVGDYVRAEAYGRHAVLLPVEQEEVKRDQLAVLSPTERLDNTLATLLWELRAPHVPTGGTSVERRARGLLAQTADPSSPEENAGTPDDGPAAVYRRIRRLRLAQLMYAEYRLAESRFPTSGSPSEFHAVEPVLFAAQLLENNNSIERITAAQIDAAHRKQARGQLCRFAEFAQSAGNPLAAQLALDAMVKQIDDGLEDVGLLRDVADSYFEREDYQKVIELCERIVRQISDAEEAQQAQLRIIDIYTEQIKAYDKAITECQKFLRAYPKSPRAGQMEFLLGRLAYLSNDYGGAVGQMDRFQKLYPNSPQVGNAMMLAALSRTSEGNTQDAIRRFRTIIERYPDGDLAARSKFLIGYAQISSQQYQAALETFTQLVEQFPESPYVTQAQGFIDRLKRVAR